MIKHLNKLEAVYDAYYSRHENSGAVCSRQTKEMNLTNLFRLDTAFKVKKIASILTAQSFFSA